MPVKDEPTNPDARNERVPDFQQNTNLEEISDWLTKILVGVGLTQLSGISQALNQAAVAIQDALGSPPQNYVFALAILIYFPVCGFLVGYLWTRLNLANALTRSELERRHQNERNTTEADALSIAAQTVREMAEATAPETTTTKDVAPNKVPKKVGLWVDDNPSNNGSLKQSWF